jgi:hypothetical protein
VEPRRGARILPDNPIRARINLKTETVSEESEQVVSGEIHVVKDFQENAGTQGLFSMCRDGGFPAVRML